MKYIIIGLGNFGASLALKLAEDGHEVIGVDNNELNIDKYKDKLTHVLAMDSTNELAISQLPLEGADAIVIALGRDSGAAITTAALFKKYLADCRIVARSTSDIQTTIFEAMGVGEIVNPEAEYAENLANRLTIAGSINTYLIDDRYEIVEFEAPKEFIGKTVQEVDIVNSWKVSLISIIRHFTKKNLLGKDKKASKVAGVVDGSTQFNENDTLLLFGKIKDLESMMNSFQ